MKKKFDSVTAKKIINEYAEKLNYYMRENNILKMEMDDLKTTLTLNKELFFSYISENMTDKDHLYAEIKEENKRLTEKINQMFIDRTQIDKKVNSYLISYIELNKLLMIKSLQRLKVSKN
jgi:regulator of replication initiation timing